MKIYRMGDVIRVCFDIADCQPAYESDGEIYNGGRLGTGTFDFDPGTGAAILRQLSGPAPLGFTAWEQTRLENACRCAYASAPDDFPTPTVKRGRR